jgi:hypothetical protein
MRELFIYYRIQAAKVGLALETVNEFQARLRVRHPGLSARLLRRPDEQDDMQTWMEIYSFALAKAGVTPEIESEISAEATALAPFITGARHTEVFVPCAS